MRAVIFGAGSIGRGFIGELLHRSDFEIVFVDVDRDLLQRLSSSGGYFVDLIEGTSTERVRVPVCKVIHGSETDAVATEIEQCDLIFTAVGINALKHIVVPLAKGLNRRTRSVNIILCENMANADVYVRGLLAEHLSKAVLQNVGLLRASIGRMVPVPENGADALTVKAETYAHLPVDEDGIVGDLPAFEGLELMKPFDYAIERKLYIHNLGHVACAWMGGIKGYTYIWQSISDDDIKRDVVKAMEEAASGLSRKYGVSKVELKTHIENLIERFSNRELGDTVYRVGRDLMRKLSPSDRVIGALKLCNDYELPTEGIIKVIVAGLKYCRLSGDDEAFCGILKSKGIAHVLAYSCEITDAKDVEHIIEQYREV